MKEDYSQTIFSHFGLLLRPEFLYVVAKKCLAIFDKVREKQEVRICYPLLLYFFPVWRFVLK